MLDYLIKGGPLVWPILAVSVWALALILERFFYLRRERRAFRVQAEEWFALYESQGRDVALAKLAGAQGLLPEILAAAWDPDHTAEGAEKGVEEVLSRHFPLMERYLGTIGTLGSLEPMIGLLGTITGMIESFGGLAGGAGADLGTISGGLSVAMINTQLGLATALPILFAHNYLRNRHRELLSAAQNVCARALRMGHRHVA